MVGALWQVASFKALSLAVPDDATAQQPHGLTKCRRIVMFPLNARFRRIRGYVSARSAFLDVGVRQLHHAGNVVDLAVAIIIGAAFTGVVGSLVKDVFNPLLGLMTGGVDFSNVFFSLNGQHYANLADAQKAGAPTLNLGLFINAIIQFVIVSFTVFWIVKALPRLNVRHDSTVAPPKSESSIG